MALTGDTDMIFRSRSPMCPKTQGICMKSQLSGHTANTLTIMSYSVVSTSVFCVTNSSSSPQSYKAMPCGVCVLM